MEARSKALNVAAKYAQQLAPEYTAAIGHAATAANMVNSVVPHASAPTPSRPARNTVVPHASASEQDLIDRYESAQNQTALRTEGGGLDFAGVLGDGLAAAGKGMKEAGWVGRAAAEFATGGAAGGWGTLADQKQGVAGGEIKNPYDAVQKGFEEIGGALQGLGGPRRIYSSDLPASYQQHITAEQERLLSEGRALKRYTVAEDPNARKGPPQWQLDALRDAGGPVAAPQALVAQDYGAGPDSRVSTQAAAIMSSGPFSLGSRRAVGSRSMRPKQTKLIKPGKKRVVKLKNNKK